MINNILDWPEDLFIKLLQELTSMNSFRKLKIEFTRTTALWLRKGLYHSSIWVSKSVKKCTIFYVQGFLKNVPFQTVKWGKSFTGVIESPSHKLQSCS